MGSLPTIYHPKGRDKIYGELRERPIFREKDDDSDMEFPVRQS